MDKQYRKKKMLEVLERKIETYNKHNIVYQLKKDVGSFGLGYYRIKDYKRGNYMKFTDIFNIKPLEYDGKMINYGFYTIEIQINYGIVDIKKKDVRSFRTKDRDV